MFSMVFRVGLVGLGKQTTSVYMPAVLASRNLKICGVVDKSSTLSQQISRKNGVTSYKDIDLLFKKGKPDFIIIAVPHSEYLSILKKAVENGVHVLKEKPLSMNVKEGRKICNILKGGNIYAMLTLQRRFNPSYIKFKKTLPKLKNIFFFEAKYSISINNPHEGWRGQRKTAGGGCILDMGYHMIDLLTWYFGLPSSVIAEFSARAKQNESYDAEDTAVILAKYKKQNLYGSIIISRVIPPKTEYLKVVSSTGVIELLDGIFYRYNSEGKLLEKLENKLSKEDITKKQLNQFTKMLSGKKEEDGDIFQHMKQMAFIESCYSSQKLNKYVNPAKYL